MGFFVLSSFLLTYRLLIEFSSSTCFKDILRIFVQYSIRRFFRIYLVFVLFCFLIKYNPSLIGGNGHLYGTYYETLFNMISLESVGNNHLWTIAPECKYYFFIPFISYCAIAFGKYWLHAWLITAVLMCFNEFYLNIFSLNENDFALENAYKLKSRFAIFYSGSLVAIIYFKLGKNFENLKNNFLFKKIINVLLIFLFMFAIRFFSEFWSIENIPFISISYINRGFFWSFTVLLMLLGAPNYFTNIFSENNFLKYCGKFSFGMYLFHPMCMLIIKSYTHTKSVIEQLILVVFLSFFVGYLFFLLIENNLMLFANVICKKLEAFKYFTKKSNTFS
jgi:peptidoglycan/LPS O-acetylase OafA/YrhL